MTSAVSALRRTTFLFPLSLLTLALHSEEMPGPVGAHGPALSLLFIMAWTGLTKDVCGAGTEVEALLERGRQYLMHGQFADALSQYHTAVETDPDNYMTYFQRATVYLAMGKSRSALPDLDRVLVLKPDFNAARLQRASVKVKQGRLDDAMSDYNEILSRDPTFSNALEGLSAIGPLRENIDNGKALYNLQDFANAAHQLSLAIEHCPWDVELRELRAECYLHMAEHQKAVADLRAATKLLNDNTAGYLKLSKLLYDIGNAEESLIEIRECLKLDPDEPSCFKHYRQVRKLVKAEEEITKAKEASKWDECLTKIKQFEKLESKVPAYVSRTLSYQCSCHSKASHVEEALSICGRLLGVEPDNAEALCDRADTLLLNEDYEAAIDDFKKAESIETGDDRLKSRAKEGKAKAEKLLKQSQKRDYYKILGVKKTAGKAEIMKAYRKLAAQWHPDSQPEGADKEKAEKKFIDIAAAKEVLTDPEKRAKFDQGEDPLDAEQQAGAGNPFFHHQHGGFNPFGQGGYQFKFHFN